MTASDDLLHRIETSPELADFLVCPGDFDIKHRDPIEDLSLPSGLPLTPIAADGAGGTYFLCGTPGTTRPVLYADSEGQATLMAADLVEAVTLIATHPYWRDLLFGHSVEELEEELISDDPDYLVARAEFLDLLGVTPPTPEEAIARLRAASSRTVPDFLPTAQLEDEVGIYQHLGAPH